MDELNIESDRDDDSCTNEELENIFDVPYALAIEEAISLDTNYILYSSVDESSGFRIGVGLSNKSCAIYNLTETSLIKQAVLNTNSFVTNVKFGHKNQLFYSSSIDGVIKVWDLRTSIKNSIIDFKDDTSNNKLKPILSFDIAKNDKLLCAGTELVDGDAFLLFWDLRKSALVGGYWESHTDDVVQVAFNKTNNDSLVSGSTDGLVNTYNLLENSEEDALLYTYKTNSSVEKINWYSYQGKQDAISCVTHTSDMHLWKVDDNDAYAVFERSKISQSLKRTSSNDSYIAGVHEIGDEGELIVVAGSNVNKGRCLRLLKVISDDLQPMSQLLGNKQIVRTSCYSNESGCLVTGGENGILSVWKPGKVETSQNKSKNTMKSHKIHKKKPY